MIRQTSNTKATVAETPVRQAGGRPGVLVVDDEHLVRIMVQLCLERNGYDVWLAHNGPEAIDFHRQHREEIDLALIDVHLPGLDGLQTLIVMRELNPNMLACFMSSDTCACELEKLVPRGTACFITKPFCLDDLVNLLRLMVQSVPAALLPSGRYKSESDKNPHCGDDHANDPCGR